MLLSPFTDGEASTASLFGQGSAEIGLILARLTPLPTTPRSVTVLPVLPDVAAVDIVGESKPLFTPAICKEVKDAAPYCQHSAYHLPLQQCFHNLLNLRA
jgi:hypothetical protein